MSHRLVLSEEQSAFIRGAGIRFAVVHPGSTENAGRYVLDLIECDYTQACQAVEVAQGRRRAGKAIEAKADRQDGPMVKEG